MTLSNQAKIDYSALITMLATQGGTFIQGSSMGIASGRKEETNGRVTYRKGTRTSLSET